jgi:hypothetical protein
LSVSLVNTINNSCAITASLPLVVLPLPQIDLNELGLANVLVCSDDPTFTRTLDAGLVAGVNPTDYTYQWFKDGNPISGATQPTLVVNEEGIYTVEVSTISLCSRTRSIVVTASEKATISSIDVTDITETNSITVNTTGIYNLQFSAHVDRVSGSGLDVIDIWYRVQGVDVPNSNTKITIAGNVNESKVVASWNFYISLNANQYVELMYSVTDLAVQIVAETANLSVPFPATPSLIVTMQKIN